MDFRSGTPLLFEALPPAADAPDEVVRNAADRLAPLHGLATAVNVPEVLGSVYHPMEARDFALQLQRTVGVPAVVNRVTVHHDAPALQAWLRETWRLGVDRVVFVGGDRHTESYPGLGVGDALRLAAGDPHAPDAVPGALGAITIPTRRRPTFDEPERILRKQAAGAQYALSQILLEPDHARSLHHDLARASHRAGVEPLPIVWSLAPVARRKDLRFLEWLGVHVPKDVRAHLRDAPDEQARIRRSHAVNEAVLRDLLAHAEEGGSPVGVCVEHVMQNNVDAALALLERARDVVREFRGVAVVA